MGAEPMNGSSAVGRPPASHGAVAAWLLGRKIGVAASAVAVIVAAAEVRIPIGLPGHRGMMWLAALVAVALATRHRESVVAVGAASTVTTQFLHIGPGAGQSARYLGAAVLLYALSFVPVIGRRGWFIALTAAPIHLVALLNPAAAGLHRGYLVGPFTAGFSEKALFHLAFGLAAGLVGWGVASGVNLSNASASQRDGRWSRDGTRW
jgi:hypothetical protein